MKASEQSYKIYSLCYLNDYMMDFRFTSKTQKVAEMRPWSDFTASEAVILDLAQSLTERFPQPKSFYVLHIDNFFIMGLLYKKLYEFKMDANNTAKTDCDIPKKLALFKTAMTKKKNHDEGYNCMIRYVNCIGFCDMVFAFLLIIVHDPTEEEYVKIFLVKRPEASLKLVQHSKDFTRPKKTQKITETAEITQTQ